MLIYYCLLINYMILLDYLFSILFVSIIFIPTIYQIDILSIIIIIILYDIDYDYDINTSSIVWSGTNLFSSNICHFESLIAELIGKLTGTHFKHAIQSRESF